MNEESNIPGIDPELEARIVALVLGEASDFERDELNRLVQQRPELAAFKEQMQSVHGLLRHVGAGESVAEEEDWKLSSKNRDALLAVMSGEANDQPAQQVVIKPAEQPRSAARNLLWNVAKIAAVLLVAGFFGSLALPSIYTARSVSSSAYKQLGLAMRNYHGAFATLDTDLSAVEEFANAESDEEQDSRSALSDIRDALGAGTNLPNPYYLQDDVQYFPAGPEFKLPRAAGESGAAEEPTDGVNGPGPGRKTADGPAVVAQDGAVWSDGHTDGNRTADLRPTLGAVNNELSFPRFAGSDQERSFPEVSRPEGGPGLNSMSPDDHDLYLKGNIEVPHLLESTVDVPDQGTVLLGGIKRLPMSRSEPDVPRPPTVPMPTLDDHEASSPVGDANVQFVPELGQIIAKGSKRDIDRVMDVIEEIEAGGAMLDATDEGMAMGDGPEEEAKNSPRFRERDNVVEGLGQAQSGAYGGGAFGGGGGFDGSGGFGGGFGGGATSPSQPILADSDDRTTTRAGGRFDTRAFDSAPVTNSTALEKDFRKKKASVVDGGEKEEATKESITMPGADDIALHKSRGLNPSFSVQIPESVTGTAIGQPRGELKSGEAKQDDAWAYEGRANDPQGKIAESEERYRNSRSDQYDNDAANLWERIPPSGTDEVTLRSRLDQLATNGQEHWHGYVPPMLEDYSKSMKKALAKRHPASAGLNEKTAQQEAFSTFSLHVSDVSFKLAQAALAQGEWPEAAKVRIEEFVNAFDYGDPMPSHGEKVACRVEQSIHPFIQQRNLLRVSMRTAAAGRASNTPLRLTFLLDNSGSMERIDRQQTVRRAFALLAQQLKPIDQVTLISFARQPRLLADKVSGVHAAQLVGLIDQLPSEGGTNIEAALQLAFEKAREHQVGDAQNRIILLTDGAVNLGNANPESLSRMITTMRDAGIAFDAAGISAEGLNDEILEALTRKGDGRYYLLDSLEAADDGFARQIAGALRPSAKNVKVQIEFNPKRVGHYKLLGFEKHLLNKEDFRNDKVDAAEMAAAEAGVAVYQFEAKPDGEGDVGSVSVRFRDLSTGQMIEHCWPIPYEANAPRSDQAAPSLRIATSAALLAAKLRGEPLGESVDLKTLSNLVAGLPKRDRNNKRVGQLQQMIQQARQISGQ